MLVVLVLITLVQIQNSPTPLDAFRANHAAVKAKLDFVLETGVVDASALRDGKIWASNGATLSQIKQEFEIVGTWACDGSVEYYFSGSPDSVINEGRKRESRSSGGGGEVKLTYRPKSEALFDGDTLAEHVIDFRYDPLNGKAIAVTKAASRDLAPSGKGPYSWWEFPFPYYLYIKFAETTPRIVHLNRGPFPTDVEVYTKNTNYGWLRLEVAYDPAIGYVPRHTRLISHDRAGETFVREFYLVEARPCKAGGFVPMEWYSVLLKYSDFDSAYPSYDVDSVLVPREASLSANHFKATEFRDYSEDVALTYLDGIEEIVAAGGRVRIGEKTRQLTLTNIKGRLGKRLTDPLTIPSLGSIDRAELDEFKNTQSSTRVWTIIAAVVLITLSIALFLRKRRKSANLFLTLFIPLAFVGCGPQSVTPVKLVGRIGPSVFLFDKGPNPRELNLVVRNEGARRVNIIRVTGDCSCRKVDQSQFPFDLHPGEEATIPFAAQLGVSSQPVTARFTLGGMKPGRD